MFVLDWLYILELTRTWIQIFFLHIDLSQLNLQANTVIIKNSNAKKWAGKQSVSQKKTKRNDLIIIFYNKHLRFCGAKRFWCVFKFPCRVAALLGRPFDWFLLGLSQIFYKLLFWILFVVPENCFLTLNVPDF